MDACAKCVLSIRDPSKLDGRKAGNEANLELFDQTMKRLILTESRVFIKVFFLLAHLLYLMYCKTSVTKFPFNFQKSFKQAVCT